MVLLFACDPTAPNDKVFEVDADEDGVLGADDCDDADASIGAGTAWFTDADGDTFAGTAVIACTQPDGAVDASADCDDASVGVNPLATEVCDGIDNNCDGTVDEGAGSTFYADDDADGFGDAAEAQACSEPAVGCVSSAEDGDG